MSHKFNSTRQITRLLAPIIVLTGLIAFIALPAHSNNALTGKGNGRIAFVSNRDNVERIYTMAPDGSGLTKLTNGPHQLQPAWSPDGTKIAYMDRLKDA